MYNVGAYQKAAILFEKQAFQSQSISIKKSALLNKSFCYKALGNFDLANSIIKRAIDLGKQDSLDYQLRYEAVLNNYLNHNPLNVISEINLLKFYYPSKSTNDLDLKVMNVLALNDLALWQKAKKILLDNNKQLNVSSEKIESLYFDANDVKLKKTNKAYAISLLLPGMGQIYTGHFFKGLLSLSLQTAAMTYGIYGIKNGYYFTAALPGVALFNSFYMGGADYSKALVIERNKIKINKVNQKINSALLEIIEWE